MGFRISALPLGLFAGLFRLSESELAARGMRRVIADEKPGFPCRVSLRDAEVGERVVLLSFEHHAVQTPHRGFGPIYVREVAVQAVPAVNEVPAMLRTRLLSLRGYERDGMLLTADVIEGREFETAVARMFGDEGVSYIHVHNAKPGCYNCRVDRA